MKRLKSEVEKGGLGGMVKDVSLKMMDFLTWDGDLPRLEATSREWRKRVQTHEQKRSGLHLKLDDARHIRFFDKCGSRIERDLVRHLRQLHITCSTRLPESVLAMCRPGQLMQLHLTRDRSFHQLLTAPNLVDLTIKDDYDTNSVPFRTSLGPMMLRVLAPLQSLKIKPDNARWRFTGEWLTMQLQSLRVLEVSVSPICQLEMSFACAFRLETLDLFGLVGLPEQYAGWDKQFWTDVTALPRLRALRLHIRKISSSTVAHWQPGVVAFQTKAAVWQNLKLSIEVENEQDFFAQTLTIDRQARELVLQQEHFFMHHWVAPPLLPWKKALLRMEAKTSVVWDAPTNWSVLCTQGTLELAGNADGITAYLSALQLNLLAKPARLLLLSECDTTSDEWASIRAPLTQWASTSKDCSVGIVLEPGAAADTDDIAFLFAKMPTLAFVRVLKSKFWYRPNALLLWNSVFCAGKGLPQASHEPVISTCGKSFPFDA
jgi:hypothetical protein